MPNDKILLKNNILSVKLKKKNPVGLNAKEARRLFLILQDNRYKPGSYPLRFYNSNGEGKLMKKWHPIIDYQLWL